MIIACLKLHMVVQRESHRNRKTILEFVFSLNASQGSIFAFVCVCACMLVSMFCYFTETSISIVHLDFFLFFNSSSFLTFGWVNSPEHVALRNAWAVPDSSSVFCYRLAFRQMCYCQQSVTVTATVCLSYSAWHHPATSLGFRGSELFSPF